MRNAKAIATVLLVAARLVAFTDTTVDVAQPQALGPFGAARKIAFLATTMGTAQATTLRAFVTPMGSAAGTTTMRLAALVGLGSARAPWDIAHFALLGGLVNLVTLIHLHNAFALARLRDKRNVVERERFQREHIKRVGTWARRRRVTRLHRKHFVHQVFGMVAKVRGLDLETGEVRVEGWGGWGRHRGGGGGSIKKLKVLF
jgi:hypothetical protein